MAYAADIYADRVTNPINERLGISREQGNTTPTLPPNERMKDEARLSTASKGIIRAISFLH